MRRGSFNQQTMLTGDDRANPAPARLRRGHSRVTTSKKRPATKDFSKLISNPAIGWS